MRSRVPAKYRFMIGTTSRVPGRPGLHYLILDIDGRTCVGQFSDKREIWQATPHGFHIYTPTIMSFEEMLRCARRLGADKGWVRIARKRGYAFLADKCLIDIPWPVERMIVSQKGGKINWNK